ncbi:MAG: hypothetical protein ACXWLM_05570, partial [Myxococcales bacterium]
VIFHHGLGDSRRDVLYVANELNKAGFVVAAIDSPKHGDRSYCSNSAQCASGSCTPIADMANEGDAAGATPGSCPARADGSPDFVREAGCSGCDNSKAPPLGFTDPSGHGVSGNFVLSFNLFRARDTFRQDIIDQSQLIRILSPDPTCDPAAAPTVPPPGGTCANQFITAATGVQIDKSKIYMLGQSMGGVLDVPIAAANARVRKVGTNAAGSTIVDVFSQSQKYGPVLNALLDSKGVGPSNASGYLQFLTVAKWILDPADPENFARNLLTNTIPGPLSGGVAPPGRTALQQISLCDDHVPTGFQLNLASLTGLGPVDATHSTTTLFETGAAATTACPTGHGIEHGFLLDWAVPATATSAQDDFANFFKDGTLPPPSRP